MTEPAAVETIEVTLPSGATFECLTDVEAEYLTLKIIEYADEFDLSSVSDLSDLDGIVSTEMLLHRWRTFLGRGGKDYTGRNVDTGWLTRSIKEASAELRAWKKLLGVDRTTREKTSGRGSVSEFIEYLLDYAERFGINRELMLDKGLELCQQVIALTTLYWNTVDDAPTQRELGCTAENIMEWLRDSFTVDFQAVDDYFATHDQKFWVEL